MGNQVIKCVRADLRSIDYWKEECFENNVLANGKGNDIAPIVEVSLRVDFDITGFFSHVSLPGPVGFVLSAPA
jgi:hypothetical protein